MDFQWFNQASGQAVKDGGYDQNRYSNTSGNMVMVDLTLKLGLPDDHDHDHHEKNEFVQSVSPNYLMTTPQPTNNLINFNIPLTEVTNHYGTASAGENAGITNQQGMANININGGDSGAMNNYGMVNEAENVGAMVNYYGIRMASGGNFHGGQYNFNGANQQVDWSQEMNIMDRHLQYYMNPNGGSANAGATSFIINPRPNPMSIPPTPPAPISTMSGNYIFLGSLSRNYAGAGGDDQIGSSSGSRRKQSSRRQQRDEAEASLSYNEPSKRCTNYYCNTNNTPMWRKGPLGPKTLCNACGIKYRKKEQKRSINDGQAI